jgi:endonuclease/exonuclease/phosphatase family metal-dependent hydrolase
MILQVALILQVTFMTYNIRFDTESDGINKWDNRKAHVAAIIRYEHPDFVGTQEGLAHQLEYLVHELDGYSYIGVGRDDGARAGEFSALMYNESRFELIPESDHTDWLSETPNVPSKSWDAAYPRVLTYGTFRNREDSTLIHVFNTHFDHVGQTARENSTNLILETIQRVAGEDLFVLMGDFNVTEDNPVYRILREGPPALDDAFHVTKTPHVGPHFTFEGFAVRNSPDARRIDYIFVPQGARVTKHAILSTFRGGNYASDHLPVVAKVEW